MGRSQPGKFVSRIAIGIVGFFSILLLFLSISLPPSQTVNAKPLGAADPTVSMGAATPYLGDTFNMSLTFENTGTDPGYGPFVDLVFPVTGEDGDDGVDYLSASYLGSALEDDVQTFPDEGSGSGCVNHPWLRDNTGAYVEVCGPAGDKFVSLRLPFGSFVPGQPALDITVNAFLSPNADVSFPLPIFYRGGYMYGETPLDDWCCGDTPYAVPGSSDSSTWPSAPVNPQLFDFTKSYTGPGNLQDETATGPNFPHSYTLTLDLAEGQTLTSLTVSDLLPDNLQFIRIISTSLPPTSTSLPSTTEPGGTLELEFGAMSSPADNPLEIEVEFYIPEFFDGPDLDTHLDDPVINPSTGDDVFSDNIAWVEGFWNTIDDDDPDRSIFSDPTCPGCGPLHSLQDKSIAIQKAVGVLPGTGGGAGLDQTAPGAILEYTIEIQVSDYFSFDNLLVNDVISDGQHLLPAAQHTPTLLVNGNSYVLAAAAFNSGNYSVTCDYSGATTTPPTECTATSSGASGTTTLEFDLTSEILARGEDGTLLGGCINPPPGGGVLSPCDPDHLNDGPTTATIVFRTQVLEEFVDTYPSGDVSVDQGDTLENTVDVVGDILDNSTFGLVGTESDDAAAGTSIGREDLSKTIYAINDETNSALWDRDALGRVRIKPGDKITFELVYDLLTSDVEELTFDDYFPLPVFDLTDPDDDGSAGPAWTFNSAAGIPDPGVVSLRIPGDTFYQYMTDGISLGTGFLSPSTFNPGASQDPVVDIDGPGNKLNIYYADYDDTRNLPTRVDLLISLIVTDDPFADGLFLTNMAHAYEGSTNAGDNTENAILQFVLNEPVLVSSKGIIWSSKAAAVFDPAAAGPVPFLSPGDPSVPPRWTGTINSSGLEASPIDSNLTGVDAGDTVTFAITIENQGSSLNGAFDIMLRDDPDLNYYQIPAAGLNLQVYYGDGTGPIPYQAVDTSCTVDPGLDNDPCGEELFEEGLELIDPIGSGVCSAYDANSGNNVILLTYDLELRDDVIPGQAVNTSSVFNFAGSEEGPNHLEGTNPLEDDATADVEAGFEKTLEGTEINILTNPFGVNLDDEVVIGELVQYTISAIVPEGVVPNARLNDQLDGGLAFVSCDSVSVTADIGVVTDLTPADFSGVCTETESSGISSNGENIVFNLGNITNNDRDDNLERVSVTYTAVVTNVAGNQNTLPTVLNNQADFLMDDGSGDVSIGTAAAAEVTVIEPQVITEKFTPAGTTGTATSGDAGDPVSYTITLTNPSGADDTDAFEVTFEDDFPLCPNPADGSAIEDMVIVSQSGNATFSLSGDNAAGWSLTASGFDLAPGEATTVDVSGTIDYCVSPGYSLENNANSTWTSLSGDFRTTPRSSYNPSSIERNGEQGVAGPLDDYASRGTATVSIDNPTNSKYLITSSEDHTELVNSLENVAIGEIVRFRLVATIPEGTSPNFQVRDLIPTGLMFLNDDTAVVAFVSDSGITSTAYGSLPIPAIPNICNTIGSTADASIPAMDPVNCTLQDNNVSRSTSISADGDDNFSAPGRDVYFKLGQLVNNDSDPDIEYVVIEFNALVHNDDYSGGTDWNRAGDQLRNRHRVIINGTDQGLESNFVTVRVAEPVIDVTKNITGTLPADAGDPITYQIVFSNTAAGDSSATAYDLVLSDTFDANLENLAISSVSSTQGPVCTGDGSGTTPYTQSETLTGGTLTVNLSCLDPGESITLDITGNVVDDVSAATTILNSAVGTGTSLPGLNGTTGNSTGSETPGASGSDRGERDGSDTDTGGRNDYYDLADANQTLNAPQIVKTVESPGRWAIGEMFTYDLVVNLPEGLTPGMVVYDDLPAGLEFISSNLITTTAEDGSLLVANYAGSFTNDPPLVTELPSGDIELNFGDTTTLAEFPDSDPTNNSFQVQITVRVLNVIGNQNGVTLTNQGELRYTGGTTATDTVDIEIIEPVLEVEKLTIPAPAQNLDAGDVVQYQLTLSHDQDGVGEDSQADAFDVYLTDVLDTGSGDILITSIDGTTLVGGASVDTVAAITGSGTGLTGQFDIPLGGSVVILYTAELQNSIHPDQTMPNAVDISWSSLDNNPQAARDGSGGVDDYFDSTSLNVDTADLLSITKTVLSTTEGHTSGADLTIGEEVTFSLVVSVLEGTTDSVVVTDTLPEDLNYITGTVTVTPNGPGMTTGYTGTPGWADPVLTIDLGQVVNPGDNNPANDTVTIEFEALVENTAANQNNDNKTNNVSVTDGNLVDISSADVLIVEPELSILKTADDGTPALDQIVTYTVQIVNNGLSTAYEIEVSDDLPTGLVFDSYLNTVALGPGCTTAGPTSISSTANQFDINYAELEPGCGLDITYQVRVESPPSLNTPAISSTLTNSVEVLWTSIEFDNPQERFGDSISGGVNDYENTAAEDLVVTNPELNITKDDGVLVYIPGESVTYTITVQNVGNADVSGAVVSDTLPAEGLNWTWVCTGPPPASISCDGGSANPFSDTINLSAGQSLTYSVTLITDPAAVTDMENIVTVTMPSGVIEPTPADNTDNDIDSATPEADLRITKDDSVSIISPGTTLTYSVLVENTSPSDVPGATVEDLIPAEITSWQWICLVENDGASGCTPTTGSTAVDFSDTVDLPAGSSIEYQVVANVSSSASGTLTNVASVAVPAEIIERNLTDNTDDDVDGLAVHSKELIDNRHGAVPLPDVAIGEVLTYEVVLAVPPGSMTGTHLIDTLDRGLAFMDCDMITFGSLTTSAAGGNFSNLCDTPVVSELPSGSMAGEDAGRQVDWNFGTLTNPEDGNQDLTIRYRVVVLNSQNNQSDSTPPLNNQAEWTWDAGRLTDQADAVTILEPDLSVTKSVSPITVYPGQITTFRLVIEHTPDSQTTAYDVELTDVIPADLIYQPPIRHVSGPAPSAVIDGGNPTLVILWDEFPNNGQPAVLEIDVMLDPDFNQRKTVQTIINDASLAWTSLEGDYSTPQSTYNSQSTERFYDPLSDINIYGAADSTQIRIPQLPDTGFAPGRITNLPSQPSQHVYGDLNGLRLEIPRLEVSLPIVSVPRGQAGYDLTWLGTQAGWLEGTAYPSWTGNTVLTGHAYLPSGFPGPFVDLTQLSWGDQIEIYAHGYRYIYQVRTKALVSSDDLSILGHKDQDWLTLFTCKDYSEELEGYLWREVVQAVLIDIKQVQ